MFSRFRLGHLLAAIFGVAILIGCSPANCQSPSAPVIGEWWNDTIDVRNPINLPATLPCQRIAFEPEQPYDPECGYYKPCIAQADNGDILVMGFFTWVVIGPKAREDAFIFRSQDEGETWSRRVLPPIIGREPFMSKFRNGDIMVTTHLPSYDVRMNERMGHAYIHNSHDAGITWNIRKITEDDLPGCDPTAWLEVCSSRNVLELKNRTRIFGLSTLEGSKYLWRSTDGAQTWDQVLCHYPGMDETKVMMWETYMWQAKNGDILGLYRVFPSKFPLKDKPLPPSDSDQYHGVVVFRSQDGGVTWNYDSDLGSDYGEMYPSILRLQDGRLLCNVSQRGFNPKGVRAALSDEMRNGFNFNFDSDVVMIETRTPDDESQGGGFGNTIQLSNGMLMTAYSYRGSDDRYHVEVVRWQLPAINRHNK